jgi:hypothetical protein
LSFRPHVECDLAALAFLSPSFFNGVQRRKRKRFPPVGIVY